MVRWRPQANTAATYTDVCKPLSLVIFNYMSDSNPSQLGVQGQTRRLVYGASPSRTFVQWAWRHRQWWDCEQWTSGIRTPSPNPRVYDCACANVLIKMAKRVRGPPTIWLRFSFFLRRHKDYLHPSTADNFNSAVRTDRHLGSDVMMGTVGRRVSFLEAVINLRWRETEAWIGCPGNAPSCRAREACDEQIVRKLFMKRNSIFESWERVGGWVDKRENVSATC